MRATAVITGMFAGAESTAIDADNGAPIGDDRSHVLNGAVNGASTSTISQQAVTRDSTRLGNSKQRASRVQLVRSRFSRSFRIASPTETSTCRDRFDNHVGIESSSLPSRRCVPSRAVKFLFPIATNVGAGATDAHDCPLTKRASLAIVDSSMLKKIFAGLLVLLTVLPFTAPFPAFDLTHHTTAGTTTVDDGSHGLALWTASPRTRTRLASHFDTLLVYRYRSPETGSVVHTIALAPPLLSRTSSAVLRI